MTKIRDAVVAGQFYPGSRASLLKMIESMKQDVAAKKVDAIGVISPHAGYIYSGSVAAATMASIKPKDIYIILGPNHTGMGAEFGISTADAWRTPLGDVKIDRELAGRIMNDCIMIEDDDASSEQEHSIEVQLPILQSMQADLSFVPIVVSQTDIDVYRKVGHCIARSIKSLDLAHDITIIASSDMTHYEPQEQARRKDFAAIDAILKLNEDEMLGHINELDITMCGYAPAMIMMIAAKELGARSAELVKYQTSGDASGDYSSVVGYAGIIVS